MNFTQNTSSRLVIIGQDKTSPSSRFRLLGYLPLLERDGYSVDFLETVRYPAPPVVSFRLAEWIYKGKMYLRALAGAQRIAVHVSDNMGGKTIVFLHGALTPLLTCPFYEKYLRRRAKRIVYDIDDALFASSERNARKIANIMRLSDVVICGNEYLARFAQRYCSDVIVLPTPVDTAKYVPRVTKQDDRVVIGWMGTWTNLKYLEPLMSVFAALRKEHHRLEVQIVTKTSALPGHWDDIVRLIPWTEQGEIEVLQGFDIGLMPLADNAWTRGKCAFKLIQYMAVGLPVVASPVGMNKEVVGQENGFLCKTESEWYNSLNDLLVSADLRREMGAAGRRICEERFSLSVCYPLLVKALEGCNA